MKKILAFTIVFVIMFLSSCSFLPGITTDSSDNVGDTTVANTPSDSNKIIIPDLSNVDEASAKLSITNKGLLPVVEYEYSDTIAKGNVVRTSPGVGSSVNPDTKVTLYISSGPRSIKAKEGTINWYNIDSANEDEWNFSGLEIYEGDLYIYCETTFGTSFTLKGTGFGNASLTDSFDKYAPLTLLDENLNKLPENKKINAGELFKFFIKIPLSQLESERPTHVACEIVCLIGEKEENIEFSFNSSW
ncbi:MAG: PASTA domain-containing protein [Clostridia bacterium]|nr:PASTA domain-containing protein [Clostridia bacterium]